MNIDPYELTFLILRAIAIAVVLLGFFLRNCRGPEERILLSALVIGASEIVFSGYFEDWLDSGTSIFWLLLVYMGGSLIVGLPISIAVYFVWERITGNRVD